MFECITFIRDVHMDSLKPHINENSREHCSLKTTKQELPGKAVMCHRLQQFEFVKYFEDNILLTGLNKQPFKEPRPAVFL